MTRSTLIVDSSDERQLYDVQTPSKTCNRTTTIRRFKPGVTSDEGEIIAEVQWRKLGSSMITLHGSTVPLKDWLKKDRMFSSWLVLFYPTFPPQSNARDSSSSRSRTFTASDGNQYKWSLGSGKFTVMPDQPSFLICRFLTCSLSSRILILTLRLPSLTEVRQAALQQWRWISISFRRGCISGITLSWASSSWRRKIARQRREQQPL